MGAHENSTAIQSEKVTHLVGETLECSKELAQVGLTCRQFPTAVEISSIEIRHRIDDKQTKPNCQVHVKVNHLTDTCHAAHTFNKGAYLDSDMSALADTRS